MQFPERDKVLYKKLIALAREAKETGQTRLYRSYDHDPAPHAFRVRMETGQEVAVARESRYFHTVFVLPSSDSRGISWSPHNRLTDQQVRMIVDTVLRENTDRAVMVEICPTYEHLPFPDGTDLTKWYGAKSINISQHVIDQTIYFLCVRAGFQ